MIVAAEGLPAGSRCGCHLGRHCALGLDFRRGQNIVATCRVSIGSRRRSVERRTAKAGRTTPRRFQPRGSRVTGGECDPSRPRAPAGLERTHCLSRFVNLEQPLPLLHHGRGDPALLVAQVVASSARRSGSSARITSATSDVAPSTRRRYRSRACPRARRGAGEDQPQPEIPVLRDADTLVVPTDALEGRAANSCVLRKVPRQNRTPLIGGRESVAAPEEQLGRPAVRLLVEHRW